MSKKVIAVLFGGFSSEHEVSKVSASYVISSIPSDKYTVLPIYISKTGKWFLYDGPIENIKNIDFEKFGTSVVLSPDKSHKGLLRIVGDKIKNIKIDVVFPVLHGKNGEDGTIQGLCELSDIPYVGTGVLSSSVCMDKAFTNLIAEAIGIDQAEYIIVYKTEINNDIDNVVENITQKLEYPCFVKPANAGSSVGVSRVENEENLISALNLAIKHDRKVVIERAIIGRELECAVLGNYDAQASCVGEILSGSDFYDYDAKYNSQESKTLVPADIPEEISGKIRELSKRIFKALDGRGFARVDFFLEDKTNKIMFNEINTIPGFTPISLYPVLWNETGIETSELVDKLIQLSVDKG